MHKPVPLPMISLELPSKGSDIVIFLISLVKWCVAPLSRYPLVSTTPSMSAKYAALGFLFGGGC